MYLCICIYIYIYIYIYICPQERGCVLEREHAVKVEALCVLIPLHICVLIPLYMCPRRSAVAVLETEHAVKVEALEALLLYIYMF